MAWTRVEYQFFSDRWRVSPLIWAFFDLFLGLVVLLCAIISIATTRLIKSSGLCLSSHSSREIDLVDGTGSVPKREFCEIHRNSLCPAGRNSCSAGHAEMRGICENCALPVSQCPCKAKVSFTSNQNPVANTPTNVSIPTFNSLFESNYCQTHWPDNGGDWQKINSLSSEAVDDSIIRDAHMGEENTTGLCGGRCSLCDLPVADFSPLTGRPLKRKFAKVFPDNTRGSSSRDVSQEFIENASVMPKKTPGGICDNDVASRVCSVAEREGSLQMFQEDIVVAKEKDLAGRPTSIVEQLPVSDAGEIPNLKRATWKDSSGGSQESFTYIRRLPVNHGKNKEASVERQGENVSIDGQLLECEGERTPEWSGSFVGFAHEMDEESNMEDDDGMKIEGVQDLKDALQAERKALAALYNELEKERNASATAANEAMAMISRLQEEKAAAQMESRQYQRMVEEKQLYDEEAISLLQEILVRRDQEMFALEEEAKIYRERLLSLTMNEMIDGEGQNRLGGSGRASDYVLIERDTLLLEGSEEWKTERRDGREEKLLAEIKEWVSAAMQKGAAGKILDKVRDRDASENPEKCQKLSHHGLTMSIESGRKNLLESFSSVGDEGGLKDGARSEGAAQRQEAEGYDAFQGMMDILRKEPSMRDEASLETLNEIEEKFQKQSRKGVAKNEDELRQIWKNTLKSFEAEGDGAAETVIMRNPRQQSTQQATPSGRGGLRDQGIVRDAEANRALEEKRMSVLEYVSKFEEQLHQGSKRKPLQLGRAGSAVEGKLEKSSSITTETGLDDHSATMGASGEFLATESDRDKSKRPSPGGGRQHPTKSRFRKLAADAGGYTLNDEGDRFTVRGESSSPIRPTVGTQGARCERPLGHDEPDHSEGASLVHDVYEVQRDSFEAPASVRKESPHSSKKSVLLTVNKLVRGEFTEPQASEGNVPLSMKDGGDRLGKPDPLPGYTTQECKLGGNGRFAKTMAGEGISEEINDWRGTCVEDHAMLQTCLGTPVTPSSTPIANIGNAVDQLSERLKSLESDRQMMQETIGSLRRENGEMKLLQEIAQQLRELRGMERKAMSPTESHETTIVSSIKGILSFTRLCCTMQAQLNKLARVFLRNVEPGVCRGDQHVGLCRLIHISPLPIRIRIFRGPEVKAEEIVSNGVAEGLVQTSTSSHRTLLSQQTWPMDVRERSGTALSGWDY